MYLPIALYILRLIPLLGAFFFFFFKEITLLTIAKAALGFTIFPRFPLEVDIFTAAMPAFTALLNFVVALLRIAGTTVAGETGAEVKAASNRSGVVSISCL